MTLDQNSYTKEELLACSQGELFGPGNSQLPAPNMLMMDRIRIVLQYIYWRCNT